MEGWNSGALVDGVLSDLIRTFEDHVKILSFWVNSDMARISPSNGTADAADQGKFTGGVIYFVSPERIG